MKIPNKDGDNHVWKGESRNYLEFLEFRWGVEKGNLGNGLGDYLPNWDFPLEGGGNLGQVVQWWCQRIPKVVFLQLVELRCGEGPQ
jgi:hypothetical protein